MIEFLKGAGLFIYPLGLCSLLGLTVILERLYALRSSRIFPEALSRRLLENPTLPAEGESSLERLVRLVRADNPDREGLKTYLRLEVDGLQRGLFVLDVVVSVAPLLGLMGTVAGLVQVFGQTGESGLPDPAVFSQGIALVLSTTLIGLAIAIPCLVAVSWFNRRVERFGNTLDAWLESWHEVKSRKS